MKPAMTIIRRTLAAAFIAIFAPALDPQPASADVDIYLGISLGEPVWLPFFGIYGYPRPFAPPGWMMEHGYVYVAPGYWVPRTAVIWQNGHWHPRGFVHRRWRDDSDWRRNAWTHRFDHRFDEGWHQRDWERRRVREWRDQRKDAFTQRHRRNWHRREGEPR